MARKGPATRWRAAFALPFGVLFGAVHATAQPVNEPQSASPLAIVDGEAVTLGDLDAQTREAVASLDADLAKARRRALEEAIDDRLLAIEAHRRGVTADRLFFTEIVQRVAAPTERQVRAAFDALPDPQSTDSLEAVRDELKGRLRDQEEAALSSRWSAAARKRVRIAYRADVNAPNLRPSKTLALVGGGPLTASAIGDRLTVRCDEVKQSVYRRERAALERAIEARLLDALARRRNTTTAELTRAEVTDRARAITDEDVARFFEDNRTDFDGDLASSHAMIADFLNRESLEEAQARFSARLREGSDVRFLLTQPETAAVAVPTDGSPSRGEPTAPVTVVEFGDFECPACGRIHPELQEALAGYGDRVRIVFRHFPLNMHPHARRAAEASVAARAQGRFWEFADRLYRNQRALDDASLRRYAIECGLDAKRFDRALRRESLGAVVVHDIREGRRYGVEWTPTFFVNGVLLRSYGAAALRQAIDAALAKAPRAPHPER